MAGISGQQEAQKPGPFTNLALTKVHTETFLKTPRGIDSNFAEIRIGLDACGHETL